MIGGDSQVQYKNMKTYIVTGNENKKKELQKVFPADLVLDFVQLDLDEIQSLDSHEIIRHKLREAYRNIKEPVIVEDVSAELDCLNGLPGTFVKFFELRLGPDALYKLSGDGEKVKIICTMGYYDGNQEIIVDGVLHGTVVAPRGQNGFGFDPIIVPDGYIQTCAEMTEMEKNQLSHRFKAATLMAERLRSLV